MINYFGENLVKEDDGVTKKESKHSTGLKEVKSDPAQKSTADG
jgi:hypothetical protein